MKFLTSFLAATALLVGASTAFACPGHDHGALAKQEIKQVDVEALSQWVEKSDVYIIDANTREVFEAGHIPGAIHLTEDQITTESLPPNKDAKLVFYCKNEQCSASKKAAKAAVALGYTEVHCFKGGIEAWTKAGKKIDKIAKAPAKKSKS